MRKKTAVLIFTLVIFSLLLMGCSGSSGVDVNNQGEKVDNQGVSPTQIQPVQTKFKQNERIKLGDYVVIAQSYTASHTGTNEFDQPKAGNKYVAVEVLYENYTSDKTISYNPYDWKLIDSEGYNYEYSFLGAKEPGLSSGDINPSSKVRGWLTFEVPTNSQEHVLKFTPSFWSNENIEIELF